MEEQFYVLTMLVANKPGVTSRVTGLFSGRGYNMESICGAPTHDPEISRITIKTKATADQYIEIQKQLERLIDVIKLRDMTIEKKAVRREMALISVAINPENRAELLQVKISDDEIARSFCVSSHALGNAEKNDMADILFVKPVAFDSAKTPQIAREIGELNAGLLNESRKYLLVGPGRWGSADRWLGIPVSWAEICGVGAMVETSSSELKADPSQGSHFFHNITTLGITYATVLDEDSGVVDWNWLTSQPLANETTHIGHIRLDKPFILKVDGRSSKCVMYVKG